MTAEPNGATRSPQCLTAQRPAWDDYNVTGTSRLRFRIDGVGPCAGKAFAERARHACFGSLQAPVGPRSLAGPCAAHPGRRSWDAAAVCIVRQRPAPQYGKPKLLDQLREAFRPRHYSRRTEESYVL